MEKLNLLLAAFFCFLALSSAAEPQHNDVTTGDDDLPDSSVPTFNPLIELPHAINGQETAAVVPELPASTESTEELTTVTFRHSLDDGPRGKRIRHGHRHFKPEEMSFGNDMILSSHDDVEERENDDVRRADHRRHNHRRFEREGDDDEREDHRDGHHHRFDRDGDEEREGRGQRFDRDDDDEEREGRHHHHHRHHHNHHHHHHDGEDEDEEGGVVMKMRKFLMSRF